MGDDPAGILHQVIEQAVLGGTQFDQLAFQPDLAPVEIDLQAFVDFEQPMQPARPTLGAAQYSFDPADQFARAEGFGDVIISALLEAVHPVIFFAFGGQHDHRHIADLAYHLQHFKAVNIGHHHIEQDQIGGGITHALEGLFPIEGFDHNKAIMFQVEPDEAHHTLFIIHHQDCAPL